MYWDKYNNSTYSGHGSDESLLYTQTMPRYISYLMGDKSQHKYHQLLNFLEEE